MHWERTALEGNGAAELRAAGMPVIGAKHLFRDISAKLDETTAKLF